MTFGAIVLLACSAISSAARTTGWRRVCGQPERAPLTILRDLGLVSGTESAYLYGAC